MAGDFRVTCGRALDAGGGAAIRDVLGNNETGMIEIPDSKD